MIRLIIVLISLWCLLGFCAPVMAVETPENQISKTELVKIDTIVEQALTATKEGDFALAEEYWTELIDIFPNNPIVWSNRGNVRVVQNKIEPAIEDFNEAIKIAPDEANPYLNRGVALEIQENYAEAINDYNHVLEINPEDAMAYNNRGNAKAGQEKWDEALQDYRQAIELDANFALARSNEALTLYQLGKKEQALQTMGYLARKYPMFPDIRAAFTAALWVEGKQGEAESQWVAAVGLDNRYQNLEWVKEIRRWPPEMVAALDQFLNLQ